MQGKLGTKIGMMRTATIKRYNSDGTVRVGLDEGQLYGPQNDFVASIPSTWMGPNGEFMGGHPSRGSSVVVSQGQGGQWFIVGYLNSDNVFDRSFISSSKTQMSALKEGRALIQVKGGTRLFVDPTEGMQVGNAAHFLHVNPKRNIISHNFQESMSFTESNRVVNQRVRRDLVENSTRNILNSTLDAQNYNNSLFTIGFDPSIGISSTTRKGNTGNDKFTKVRNLPLVENRELVYEFSHSFRYTTDQDESNRYTDPESAAIRPGVDKRNMRSDVLSLSLEHPNHLMEIIKGTVVDSSGNVLDINRTIIPLGRVDSLSIGKNEDKAIAHDNMRAAYRKSIGYHFEMNSRKGSADTVAQPPPDPNNTSDYGRNKSTFNVVIDKEGQFKCNIPASSEIGNIPLLTRYSNYSVLLSQEEDAVDPNSFVRNEDRQDIFLEGFAGISNVLLTPDNVEEYGQATDRITEESISLGTAFHDITKILSTFREDAAFREAGLLLVNVDAGHPLNETDEPFETLVTEEIIVSGENANAGGRSGLINLDGFISLNIGANTVDRQSMWLDCAGGIMTRLGRDKQGISYGASLDGDMLIQIGGNGIGSDFDSRFSDQNDATRNGKLDIRVFVNGQLSILRIDETGVHIVTPGRMTFYCEQDMIFKSNSNIKFEAESIMMYAETSKRIINRFPANTIG